MIRVILISIICVLSFQTMAQSTLQEILKTVERNNPRIKNQEQLLEAENLGIRSQFNLSNPEVEWEKSFSSNEGKPYELLVSQEFDFPTSYIYKNRLKKEQIGNLENIRSRARQEVLLETKLLCLDMIYQLKLKKELSQRKANAEKLNEFFAKRLKEGDANILEVNKIKMLLLNTNSQLQMVNNKIGNLTSDLRTLNGGMEIQFDLQDYPVMAMENDIQTLKESVLKEDPYLKSLLAAEKMAERETSVVKSKSLPKFSVGYRYLNSDISKEANGLKLGISIPLWENKNKVKRAKIIQQLRADEYSLGKMEKESEFLKLFQTYENLKSSLSDYKQIFSSKKHDELLKKALNFGEISGIEYLTESIYYYESIDTYLQIESEYHKTIANILKYQL